MDNQQRFKPRLGVFDATTIVVGSMIGSGIFISPSIMAGWIQSPFIMIGIWVFAGIFTVIGALAYAELASMVPRAGGQYVYIREAFGSFCAFLFGWTLFLVIQSGFNAAVAIAFAKYLGVFIPEVGEANVLFSFFGLQVNTAQLVACALIGFLSWVNILGVRQGAMVQNLFTALKVLALFGLIVMGLILAKSLTANFSSFFEIKLGPKAAGVAFFAALAVPMSKALFAYDAWNTVTFVAEEVREPHKSLPRALFFGSILVMLIYVLTNIAYMANVTLPDMALVKENRIAQEVSEMLFGGVGNTLIVIAILISTFGCVNGMILGGARVCFAMARDGLFFRPCGTLHPSRLTPMVALVFQGIWSSLLALTGSFDALLTYTTFASVLFGVMTVLGVYKLRITEPKRARPFKCWGYPFTPAIYLVIGITFLIYVIQGDPRSAGIGLLIVLSGIPVYFAYSRRGISKE